MVANTPNQELQSERVVHLTVVYLRKTPLFQHCYVQGTIRDGHVTRFFVSFSLVIVSYLELRFVNSSKFRISLVIINFAFSSLVLKIIVSFS